MFTVESKGGNVERRAFRVLYTTSASVFIIQLLQVLTGGSGVLVLLVPLNALTPLVDCSLAS